ncbi:MAG: hypothetical protein M9897_13520 [Brumimicrobium sp.]|nr:hypothetical protein [Brumimicrobium sp.]
MAHTKTYYVLILLALLFLSSCRRSREYTTVEFIVVNPVNGEPFVGMPVKLMEESGKSFGSSGKEIFEAVTDANGRALVTFRAKKGSDTWYYPYIKDEILGVSGFDFAYLKRPYMSSYFIKKDQYNEARYEITYFAYLRDEIKNVNCQGATDSLFLHRKYLELQYGSKVYDGKVVHPGCYEYYTTSIDGAPTGYRVVFMGTHIYNYEVHRGGVVSFGSDTVKLGKGEYGTIKAYY